MNLIYGNYHLVPSDFRASDFGRNDNWILQIIKYDLLDNFVYMIEHHHGPTDDASNYLPMLINFRATKIIKFYSPEIYNKELSLENC